MNEWIVTRIGEFGSHELSEIIAASTPAAALMLANPRTLIGNVSIIKNFAKPLDEDSIVNVTYTGIATYSLEEYKKFTFNYPSSEIEALDAFRKELVSVDSIELLDRERNFVKFLRNREIP